MTAARFYSSTAGAMELQSDITSSATSMTVDTVTGLPGTTPFTLVIDVGTSTEEILDVTGVAGTTLTISRGVDGSPAQAHLAGAAIRHMATARDFRDAQEHIGFSSNVHGLSGGASVVGTTSVQILTNKTASAGSAATVGLYVKGASSQTAPYMDVQDSGGTSVVTVVPGQDTLKVAGTTGINNNSSAALYHYVAKFTATDASAVATILKAAASQTADLFQVQNSSGTVLAKFDSAGRLTTPQVTSSGSISGASGSITGTLTAGTMNATTLQQGGVQAVTTTDTQTLTGKTIDASVNTLSNIPESAVTNLTTDLAALDARLDQIEAPTWTAMSGFSAGMSADAGSPPQYHVSNGRVELRGRINHSSTFSPSGSTMLTLPAGVRPNRDINFACARNFASANSGDCKVNVTTGGGVVIYTVAGETSWVSLDGIYYWTT